MSLSICKNITTLFLTLMNKHKLYNATRELRGQHKPDEKQRNHTYLNSLSLGAGITHQTLRKMNAGRAQGLSKCHNRWPDFLFSSVAWGEDGCVISIQCVVCKIRSWICCVFITSLTSSVTMIEWCEGCKTNRESRVYYISYNIKS